MRGSICEIHCENRPRCIRKALQAPRRAARDRKRDRPNIFCRQSFWDLGLGIPPKRGLRRIYSFERLVDAAEQAEIKEWTNALELELAVDGNRKINLDPGFINHGRLMLATTKKAGFRIPLKRGIYTELTLFWARGAWQKLPWSYRDYQSERVQSFITKVRAKYLSQRKELLKEDK